MAPEVSSVYSNALMTLRLQMFKSLEKNLLRSFFPFILLINVDKVPKIFTIDIALPEYLFFYYGFVGSYLVCYSSMPHMVVPMKLNKSNILGSSIFPLIPATICFTITARVSRTVNLYYLFWCPISPVKVLNK